MCVYPCTHTCLCHAMCLGVCVWLLMVCVLLWSGQCEEHLPKRCSSSLLNSFPHLSPFNFNDHPHSFPLPSSQTLSRGESETSTHFSLSASPCSILECQLLFSSLGGGHSSWRRVGSASASSGLSRLQLVLGHCRKRPSTLACGGIFPGSLKTQPVLPPLALISLRKPLFWPRQQIQLLHLIVILFLAELIPRLTKQKKNIYPYLVSVAIYQTPYCYKTIRNITSKTHVFGLCRWRHISAHAATLTSFKLQSTIRLANTLRVYLWLRKPFEHVLS